MMSLLLPACLHACLFVTGVAYLPACVPVQSMWQSVTPELYSLFWTLTVHDVYVPTKAYESEMDKVRRCL